VEEIPRIFGLSVRRCCKDIVDYVIGSAYWS